MADTLADGIITQYPDRFSESTVPESEVRSTTPSGSCGLTTWRGPACSSSAPSPISLDTDATAARLLQNQADIGAAVAQFYGEEAGAQLEALLRDHILIAGDLIAAAKAGDNAQVEERSAAWYANADEIAEFLAGANPAWPAGTLQDMMRGHLDQTLAEATAQLTGDFEASVAEYDHIATHILQMADTLADGIITQYPDRFAA